MTGPEHYREAERLLDKAAREVSNADSQQAAIVAIAYADHLAGVAQAHAALALAAAQVESVVSASPSSPEDRVIQRAWSAAIS